jgi:hypothetical protein
MGRARAIAKRRDGSRTGSFQKEICQRNGAIRPAFRQAFSTKEREHALFRHLDDDLLRKSRRQKPFATAKENNQEGERRVSEVGWAKEVSARSREGS